MPELHYLRDIDQSASNVESASQGGTRLHVPPAARLLVDHGAARPVARRADTRVVVVAVVAGPRCGAGMVVMMVVAPPRGDDLLVVVVLGPTRIGREAHDGGCACR